MPNLPKLAFTPDYLLRKELVQSIKNPKQKAKFEKHLKLNLELIKHLNDYHLLITDPDFSIENEVFLKQAQAIETQLQIQNKALKNLSVHAVVPPKRYWSYVYNILTDYCNTITKRFGSGRGEFSEKTKPHAILLGINELFLFLFVGIVLPLLAAGSGLIIPVAIISALLLVSICATILSISVYFKVDHAAEKKEYEENINYLEQKIAPRTQELENINLLLETLIDQLEEDYITKSFKEDIVVYSDSKTEFSAIKSPNSEVNLNRPSQVSMFKPLTDKDKAQALQQANRLGLMGY